MRSNILPRGGKVIVTTKTENKNIIVSVQDFGIGIEQGMLEKVFDRFFRITQPSLKHLSRFRIGIIHSRRVYKKTGWKIWAKSNKDKGSTFFFSLPLNGTG